MSDSHIENHRILLKQIKEYLNRKKSVHMDWWLTIVKMAIDWLP